MRVIAFVFCGTILHLLSCNPGASNNAGISTDSSTIHAGEIAFDKYCSGCHNFRQNGIGPELSGITSRASADWIEHFVKNPQELIDSKDPRALALTKKYSSVMPSFPILTNDELDGIIAFLHTHKSQANEADGEKGIDNPIPAPIKMSGLTIKLKLLTSIPPSSDSTKPPLARITKLVSFPGSEDLIVLDMRGKLYRLDKGKPAVYFDITKSRPNIIFEPGLGTGFGSFAFHPGFLKNGLLYTTHAEKPGQSIKADFAYPDSIKATVQWVLKEWKTSTPNAPVFSGTSRELCRINMVSGIHGVQEITFNNLSKPGDKDYGLLYIGVGDGGSVEHGYPLLPHSKERPWGTVLRIDPKGHNSANGNYGIPNTNPFVHTNSLGEIYAYGFRNPHRITWTKAGQMLVYNIGQAHIESVNLVSPGQDYGWPIREGNFLINPFKTLDKIFPLPSNDSIYNISYPVAEYDHDEGLAISGGFEYQGSTIAALKGKNVFGDIENGRLFYINTADIKKGKKAPLYEWKIAVDNTPTTLRKLCKQKRADLRFGRDVHGELYILTKTDGKIYKLESELLN